MKQLKVIFSLFTSRQKKGFLLLVCFLLLGSFLEIASLYLIFPLSEFITNNNSKSTEVINEIFGFFGFAISIQNLVLLLILTFSFKSLYFIFITYFQHRFINSIYFSTSKKLYKNQISNGYEYFRKKNHSDFMTYFQVEIVNYINFMVAFVNLTVEFFISFSVLIFLVVFLSKEIIFIGSFLIISSFLFYYFSKKYQKKWGKKRSILDNRISKIILETFTGIKELIIYQKQDVFLKIFNSVLNQKAIISTKNGTLSNISRYYLEFLLIISIGFYLTYALNFHSISSSYFITNIGIFFGASFRLLPSFNKIINYQQQIKFYGESYRIIKDKIDSKNKLTEKTNLNRFIKPNKHKKISVKIDLLKFKENQIIIKNLYLDVKRGETVGIFGESGSGKSSIINVITGLILNFKGSVELDGININDDINNFRKKIGFVTQETFMFNETLDFNITFENEVKYPKKLKRIISDLRLDSLKKSKNNNEFLGSNGGKLSGGEKQRIAVARAMYKNSEILIFDEPTSALDIDTEIQIISIIQRLKQNKFILIVSHKRDIFKICDTIYELKNNSLTKLKNYK